MAKRRNDRRYFVKVPVYRLAAGGESVNRRGQPLPDSDPDKWEQFKEIYVCVTPLSSSEPVVNHQRNAVTTYRIEITYTRGLDATMRIHWRNHWLSFVGKPIPIGSKCERLTVRAVACDPCVQDDQTGCCNV